MHVLKHVQIAAIICGTVAFLATAGEPDLLDIISIRLLTRDVGFCRTMGPPIAGEVVGDQEGTNP